MNNKTHHNICWANWLLVIVLLPLFSCAQKAGAALDTLSGTDLRDREDCLTDRNAFADVIQDGRQLELRTDLAAGDALTGMGPHECFQSDQYSCEEVVSLDGLIDTLAGDSSSPDVPRDSLESQDGGIGADSDGAGDVYTDVDEVQIPEEYPCPNGYDGKKELMPPCPYGTVFFDPYGLFDNPVQFELYQMGTEPGLPSGFQTAPGQRVVLLRARWTDFWSDDYPKLIGCPDEYPGCKACGGHCFPHQDYAFVIDIETKTVVHIAKEVFSGTSTASQCMHEGNVMPFCFSLDLPDEEIRMVFLTSGSELDGAQNVIYNRLSVFDIQSGTKLQSIPLPLL